MGYTPPHEIDKNGHWFQWGADKFDYDYEYCKVIYPSEVYMDRDYPSPRALMTASPAYVRHGVASVMKTNDEHKCIARLKPGVYLRDHDQTTGEIVLWDKDDKLTFERTAYKFAYGMVKRLDQPVTMLGFQSKDDGTWGQSYPLTYEDKQLVNDLPSNDSIPATYGRETKLPIGWEDMPVKTIARLVAKAFLQWYEDEYNMNYGRDELIDLTTGYGVILVDSLTDKILKNGVIKTIDGKTAFTGDGIGRGVRPVIYRITSEPVD